MIPGDIVPVRDTDGQIYEAVIRRHILGKIWRFEWISGPNDMDESEAVFDEDDEWKVQ